MTDRDKRVKVISLLERYIEIPNLAGSECYGAKIVDMPAPLITDVIALLKDQEPRVMTLEEIKDYLDDPDGDKKPLWLEWHSIPALSGWVLASQVSDLMKRYMDSYNNTWRPWTSRPADEQRKAEPWE